MTSLPPDRELEESLAQDCSRALAGVPRDSSFDVAPDSALAAILERYLPAALARAFPAWKSETLDGVRVDTARRDGEREVTLSGMCILMSDQARTPFLACLAIADTGRALDSGRICIGIAGDGRLGISEPATGAKEWRRQIDLFVSGDDVAWRYIASKARAGDWVAVDAAGC